MKKLNKSQQKILDYLRERSQDGVPPSVREICAATGLKSTSTVHAHLKALEENGFISRDAGLNRAIHISGVERSVQVPVLGRVTAGLPILAVEDVEGYLPINESQCRGRELFALRVVGESMDQRRYSRRGLCSSPQNSSGGKRRYCSGAFRG